MHIGILGGTFDPVHSGHLALAEAALKLLSLDKLYFVPACKPPLKDKNNIASAQHRCHMVQRAIKHQSCLDISFCEIERGGVSYTIDTVRYFRNIYPPPHELYFITGGDWARDLTQWKHIDEIFSLVHFIVAKRPGYASKHLPREVDFLDFVPLNVSATEIRAKLGQQC